MQTTLRKSDAFYSAMIIVNVPEAVGTFSAAANKRRAA